MLISRLAHLLFFLITACAAAVIASGCSTARKSKPIYSQLFRNSHRLLSSENPESNSNPVSGQGQNQDNDGLSEKERAEADVLIRRADEAYDKDKDSWYRRAAEDYKTFVNLYPAHPLAPRALFRIGEIRFRLRNCASCDLGPVYDALESFLRILHEYPGSAYDSDARRRVRACREIMAEYEVEVGLNLLKSDKVEAAILRFQSALATAREGVKTFPDQGQESEQGAEAIYDMGYAYKEMGKLKEAREAFLLLNNEYPRNVHRMEAEDQLVQLMADPRNRK